MPQITSPQFICTNHVYALMHSQFEIMPTLEFGQTYTMLIGIYKVTTKLCI